MQAKHNPAKKHVDPTAAFNFEDDFSAGTIHGKNDAIHAATTGKGETTAIELSDNDDVSIIEFRTLDDTDAHGAQEQRRRMRSAGDRVATCSRPPAIGPTAEATPAGATGLGPVAADGGTVGGPGGK